MDLLMKMWEIIKYYYNYIIYQKFTWSQTLEMLYTEQGCNIYMLNRLAQVAS
jgi:hypothetical protein